MVIPDTLTPEQLDRATTALLKLILQTGDRGYQDSIDAFDPLPTAANNWLRGEDGVFSGVFIDNQPDGSAKRVKFRIAKVLTGGSQKPNWRQARSTNQRRMTTVRSLTPSSLIRV
jgi:hypothetical protein